MGLENKAGSENKSIEPLSVPRERVNVEKIQADMNRVREELKQKQKAGEAAQNQQADVLRHEMMNHADAPTNEELKRESEKNLFQNEDERWHLETLAQQERNKSQKQSWKEFFGFRRT